MNRHLLASLALLVAIGAMFACIAAFKSNGATDHPLMVNTAARNPDPAMPAWRLMTLCPVDRRNVPILIEESA